MKKFLQIYILLTVLTTVMCVSANDVIVTVNFDAHENISDEFVGGTLTAEVVNLTAGAIRNVNLRPDGANEVAVSKEVLQFGLLESGDSGVVSQAFHSTQASIDAGKPTTWRLDYDEVNGSHKQLIVTVD